MVREQDSSRQSAVDSRKSKGGAKAPPRSCYGATSYDVWGRVGARITFEFMKLRIFFDPRPSPPMASLGAQTTPADSGRSAVDVALGVMMATPADVNVRPLCDELNLPCGSPRTFPDFGVVLQLAVTAAPHVAIVAEASRYANRWDTLGVDPASRRSNNDRRARRRPAGDDGTDALHEQRRDRLSGIRAGARRLGIVDHCADEVRDPTGSWGRLSTVEARMVAPHRRRLSIHSRRTAQLVDFAGNDRARIGPRRASDQRRHTGTNWNNKRALTGCENPLILYDAENGDAENAEPVKQLAVVVLLTLRPLIL